MTLAGTLPLARSAALVALFSGWAAVLVLVAFNGSKLYSVPLIAGTLFPVVLFASRNPRLFLLMGLVFTSVLGLSINFGRHIHMGGAPSFSIDLADIFMVPLVVFLVRDRALGFRRGYVLSAVSPWIAGAILLGLLTVLMGPHRSFAAYEVARMVKCWILFLVIANECVRERHFHHVVTALAAMVAVNVAVAALQYTVKGSLGLQALGEASADAVMGANYSVYMEAGQVYRVSALVGHPNLFGAYLAALLPVFMAAIFCVERLRARAGLVLVTLAGIVALVATLSRTSWADYAAAMLCLMGFLYLHPTLRGRWTQLKWMMVGLLVLAAVALSGPVIQRWTASDSGALDFRYEWLGVAWRMIQEKPLLGWGLNSFSYQLEGHVPYSTARMVELFGSVWPVVHNTYFLIWTEQGLVGLVLFLGLNVHLLWMAWRNTRWGLSNTVTLLNMGLFAALVALLVDGLASFYIRVPGPARIFWVLAGLVVASHYWNLRTAQALVKEPVPPGTQGTGVPVVHPRT
jgi:putative inorganic carbon (hco3(-)) transporter